MMRIRPKVISILLALFGIVTSQAADAADIDGALQRKRAANNRFYDEVKKLPDATKADYDRLSHEILIPAHKELQNTLTQEYKERLDKANAPVSKKIIDDTREKQIQTWGKVTEKPEEKEAIKKIYLELNKAGISKAKKDMPGIKAQVEKIDEVKRKQILSRFESSPATESAKGALSTSGNTSTTPISEPKSEVIIDGSGVPKEIEFIKHK